MIPEMILTWPFFIGYFVIAYLLGAAFVIFVDRESANQEIFWLGALLWPVVLLFGSIGLVLLAPAWLADQLKEQRKKEAKPKRGFDLDNLSVTVKQGDLNPMERITKLMATLEKTDPKDVAARIMKPIRLDLQKHTELKNIERHKFYAPWEEHVRKEIEKLLDF